MFIQLFWTANAVCNFKSACFKINIIYIWKKKWSRHHVRSIFVGKVNEYWRIVLLYQHTTLFIQKIANCWVFFWRKLVYIRIRLSHHNMLFDHFRQWAHVPTGFKNKMHMIRWLNYYTVTAFKPFGNFFSCARMKLIFLQFNLVRARACCQTEHQFQLLLDSMMLDPLIHTKSAILCTTFDIHILFFSFNHKRLQIWTDTTLSSYATWDATLHLNWHVYKSENMLHPALPSTLLGRCTHTFQYSNSAIGSDFRSPWFHHCLLDFLPLHSRCLCLPAYIQHEFLAFSISCWAHEKDEKEKKRQEERQQHLTLVSCFNIVPPEYEFQFASGRNHWFPMK